MELVCFVGKDKESWGQIQALVNRFECEKIVIVKDKETADFPLEDERIKLIEINGSKNIIELKEDLLQKLKKELSGDFEVALSIASGNGKEHMALISSLLSIPVGIRLAAFTKDGVVYIN